MSPIEALVFDGLLGYSEGVIYDDGTKVDFNVAPVELLRRIVDAPELPADLDNGYRVLLDEDWLAARLKPCLRSCRSRETSATRTVLVGDHLRGQVPWRDELLAARTSSTASSGPKCRSRCWSG